MCPQAANRLLGIRVPTDVWKQDWVVQCQEADNGFSALKYLAPYVFRVAISNNRILALADGKVTFRYKDTDTGKTRRCPLSAEEFIRRFLQHVLPKGYVKVRYYGFISPSHRARLVCLREQLGRSQPDAPALDGEPQAMDQPADCVRCPTCGQVMQKQKIMPAYERKPP